jgi:hypothetical protein
MHALLANFCDNFSSTGILFFIFQFSFFFSHEVYATSLLSLLSLEKVKLILQYLFYIESYLYQFFSMKLQGRINI